MQINRLRPGRAAAGASHREDARITTRFRGVGVGRDDVDRRCGTREIVAHDADAARRRRRADQRITRSGLQRDRDCLVAFDRRVVTRSDGDEGRILIGRERDRTAQRVVVRARDRIAGDRVIHRQRLREISAASDSERRRPEPRFVCCWVGGVERHQRRRRAEQRPGIGFEQGSVEVSLAQRLILAEQHAEQSVLRREVAIGQLVMDVGVKPGGVLHPQIVASDVRHARVFGRLKQSVLIARPVAIQVRPAFVGE